VTIEAGAAADVSGGFSLPSIGDLLRRFPTQKHWKSCVPKLGQGNGEFADTQVAGASKGLRFMVLVVKGPIAASGGGTTGGDRSNWPKWPHR